MNDMASYGITHYNAYFSSSTSNHMQNITQLTNNVNEQTSFITENNSINLPLPNGKLDLQKFYVLI